VTPRPGTTAATREDGGPPAPVRAVLAAGRTGTHGLPPPLLDRLAAVRAGGVHDPRLAAFLDSVLARRDNHLAARSGATTRELRARTGHMRAALIYQHASDEANDGRTTTGPSGAPPRPHTTKAQPRGRTAVSWAFGVERMTGIEPAYSAWEADVLPLNYIRSVLFRA
jgi:hypothetical protein